MEYCTHAGDAFDAGSPDTVASVTAHRKAKRTHNRIARGGYDYEEPARSRS